MAGTKISGLTALTTPDAVNDLLAIVDVSDTSMAATGTDKKIPPQTLLRSIAAVSMPLTALETDDMATGDGQATLGIGADMNGLNLTSVLFLVGTAGTTGTSDVQLRRKRSGASVDMLSTKVTIDSTEATSATAATAAVINTANDDLATGDLIYADVDALSTTKPKGGVLVLGFRAP